MSWTAVRYMHICQSLTLVAWICILQVAVRIRDSNDADLRSIEDLLQFFRDEVAGFR